jgi:hypothetical protein
MKTFHFSSALLFGLLILLFTACDQENIDEVIPADPGFQPEEITTSNFINALRVDNNEQTNEEEALLSCVELDYPFEVALASGATLAINSSEEFLAAVDPTSQDPVVDFVYPLTGTDAEGNVTIFENAEELAMAAIGCIPQEGWEDSEVTSTIPAFEFTHICLDLVYPISLVDDDGNTYVVNDEDEFLALYMENFFLRINLPIQATSSEGEVYDINDIHEFYAAEATCSGNEIIPPVIVEETFVVEGFCGFLQFPFNLRLGDGTIVTVNDENEYATTILSGTDDFELLYPFTLLQPSEEGMIETVITNDNEYIASFLACGIEIIIEPAEPCDTPTHVLLFFNAHNIFTVYDCPFDIAYPVDVTIDGRAATLNSVEDYFAETGAPSRFGDVQLIYPIDVTVAADGSVVTLNSDEEVCAFITSCE